MLVVLLALPQVVFVLMLLVVALVVVLVPVLGQQVLLAVVGSL